jgi:hypothetical protein
VKLRRRPGPAGVAFHDPADWEEIMAATKEKRSTRADQADEAERTADGENQDFKALIVNATQRYQELAEFKARGGAVELDELFRILEILKPRTLATFEEDTRVLALRIEASAFLAMPETELAEAEAVAQDARDAEQKERGEHLRRMNELIAKRQAAENRVVALQGKRQQIQHQKESCLIKTKNPDLVRRLEWAHRRVVNARIKLMHAETARERQVLEEAEGELRRLRKIEEDAVKAYWPLPRDLQEDGPAPVKLNVTTIGR